MIAIMSDLEFSRLFAAAPRTRLPPGAPIFRESDPVRSAIWIEEGQARLFRTAQDGRPITLLRGAGPCWFAEASVFTDRYHCDAEAVTGLTLRWLGKSAFLGALTANPPLALSAMAALARDLRTARAQAELMARPKVAERLDGWLALHGAKPKQTPWTAVASEIGVSPAALYRELAKRRAASPP